MYKHESRPYKVVIWRIFYFVNVIMNVAMPMSVPIEPIANESPGGTDHDERCFVPFGST